MVNELIPKNRSFRRFDQKVKININVLVSLIKNTRNISKLSIDELLMN